MIASFQTGITRLSKSSEAHTVSRDEINGRRDTIALDTVEELDFAEVQEAAADEARDAELEDDADRADVIRHNNSHAVLRDRTLTVDVPWDVVVVDKCHNIKNPTSSSNKTIALLQKQGLLLVSATPLSNYVRDMYGYVHLAWNACWPFKY